MVSFATRADLRGLGIMPVNEQAQLRKALASVADRTATFLSHSSKDQELVVGATRVLTNHGAIVYVDEVDPAMPPYTNKETAKTLKQRVAQTKKFVLLASENSKNSKWVPWELGIADGYKGLDHIAIFPAVASAHDTAWTSSEYLGIYRRVVYGDLQGFNGPVWMVWDEETNTASHLKRWLAS